MVERSNEERAQLRGARHMRRIRRALLAVAGWTAYVALASYLGMTGGDPTTLGVPAWENMTRMWRESSIANAIFALGLIIMGSVAWMMARRGRQWASAAVAFLGAYATFAAAFAIQAAQKGSDVLTLAPAGLIMVLLAGWMGLLFAAAAPLAVARVDRNDPLFLHE